MFDVNTFAYFLSQDERGWRWTVCDEYGVTVADGVHPSQAAAQAAVKRVMGSSGGSEQAAA